VYKHIRPHLPQLIRYLIGGFGAAGMELGSYKLMLFVGVWYLAAGISSSGIGLVSAFLLHKYFSFRKQEKKGTGKQAVRYAILQGFNAIAQIGMLFVFVEFFGVEEFIAKILGIGITVCWNFFLYKFFVYA
jgi:putative flippase GtrA